MVDYVSYLDNLLILIHKFNISMLKICFDRHII